MKDEYVRKAKVVNVVDGDTFDVDIDLGYGVIYKDRLRLKGIDAYEPTLRNGTTPQEKIKGLKAKEYLNTLMLGQNVFVKSFKNKKGKYGRYIADVYLYTGESIADILESRGFLKKWT